MVLMEKLLPVLVTYLFEMIFILILYCY